MGIWDRISRRLDELSEDFLPDQVRDTIEGARELIARGRYGAAVAALEQALREKPDQATALYLLGVAHLRGGDPAKAAEAFRRAADARAGFGEALVGIGEARLAAGDPLAAIPTVRAALAVGGGREMLADAYGVLGRAYLAAGDTDKGLRELRKALAEDPTDAEAAVALAHALLSLPGVDPDEARPPLEKICAGENPPASALSTLGRLQLRAGQDAAAEKSLLAALTATPPSATAAADAAAASSANATMEHSPATAWVGGPIPYGSDTPHASDTLAALSDLAARRSDPRAAHDYLLQALALTPKRPDLHARLGDRHRALKNWDAALTAYDHALSLGAGTATLEAALDTALAAELTDRAAAYADRLLALDPGHRRARAARTVRDLPADAAAALAASDDVLAPTARGVYLAARRRELSSESPAGDLYALARRLHHIVRTRAELAAAPELAADAAATIESYDRPLLVTVMGEFSSGKSTFVNAFLGADVAPVGITPTTATINILQYGRERGGRIVYHDDRVREIPWEQVGRTLGAIDSDEARRIRHVEVLYPLESLTRVNIVDTPGLNSILPEHEATARRFIAQADAIVWLFTVGQAGKATEREALARIRGEGKRVLGVVNKIDQAPDEAGTIVAHLRRELGDLVEELVPVSARRALAARKATPPDAEGLAASSWPALDAALESRFFRQARSLKRDACARRLGVLLARARARADAEVDTARARVERLRQAAAGARADAVLFVRQTVEAERQALAERAAEAYRAAAREVLELVRPRKLPFGSHSATGPDRDYLIGFLERALDAALQPTRATVAEELRRAGRDAAAAANTVTADAAPTGAPPVGLAADLDRHADDAVLLLDARVFQRAAAYLRGYLRGGRIDDFFARVLPKLELTEDNVYHALVRDAPDLDAELAGPLAAAGEGALRALAARLDRLAAAADLARADAEDVLLATLDACEDERRALAGPT